MPYTLLYLFSVLQSFASSAIISKFGVVTKHDCTGKQKHSGSFRRNKTTRDASLICVTKSDTSSISNNSDSTMKTAQKTRDLCSLHTVIANIFFFILRLLFCRVFIFGRMLLLLLLFLLWLEFNSDEDDLLSINCLGRRSCNTFVFVYRIFCDVLDFQCWILHIMFCFGTMTAKRESRKQQNKTERMKKTTTQPEQLKVWQNERWKRSKQMKRKWWRKKKQQHSFRMNLVVFFIALYGVIVCLYEINYKINIYGSTHAIMLGNSEKSMQKATKEE